MALQQSRAPYKCETKATRVEDARSLCNLTDRVCSRNAVLISMGLTLCHGNGELTRYGEGALSSDRLKKKAVTGSVTCFGQKAPEAPISTLNPSTTPDGSRRPFNSDSYATEATQFQRRVYGADALVLWKIPSLLCGGGGGSESAPAHLEVSEEAVGGGGRARAVEASVPVLSRLLLVLVPSVQVHTR